MIPARWPVNTRERSVRLKCSCGAFSLDVARLLALITDALVARSSGAVSAQMSGFAAVITLLPVGTIARHVSVSSARVARLASTSSSTVSTASEAAAKSTPATLGAVARYVADFTALVAFSAAGAAIPAAVCATGRFAGAVARDMARLSAAIAGLVFLGLGAVAAHMALLTAVIALRITTSRAITSLMGCIATIIAASRSSRAEIHPDWFLWF